MSSARHTHGRRRRSLWIACATLAWLAAMAAAASMLAGSQAAARSAIRTRLQARVASGAEFASLYVHDIFKLEREQARLWLERSDSSSRLTLAAAAFGSSAAVLLDRHGRLRQVVPAKPSLIGVDLAPRYSHLRAAVAGHAAVSNVVPSAARALPVVGFAVPFGSPEGRRVFSVAFGIGQTPLGAFMRHLLVTPGRHVYLIDGAGRLIAGDGLHTAGAFNEPGPQLTRLLATRRSVAPFTIGGHEVLARAPVPGTPWQIVVTVPTTSLYTSIDGPSRTLSWLALLGLAIAGLVIILIGAWLARSRDRLTQLAAELERLARIDSLTGVSNRRDLEDRLAAGASAARRGGTAMSILLVDIDHFKLINDTHGHNAGDAVLAEVAQALRDALRVEDTVGRWGGEEFLAILPSTSLDAAVRAGERLRTSVAAASCEPHVTVTVGVAELDDETVDELIGRADAALYEGKTAGRNTVRAAPVPRDLGVLSVRS
jgi:diguanylate cyclase (GGDEF)-like protein